MGESISEQDALLGVEIRHLVALAAIARTGSFSGAGRELGYAQSAISQQIATLERAAGHRLIDRPGGPRPVTLTEAGILVLHHGKALAARLGAVRADLDGLAAGRAGRLRVGVFQSASARIVPAILPIFRQEWPDIDLTLRNMVDQAELERGVIAGELDVAFLELDADSPELDSIELLVDPYVALFSKDHRLAGRKQVGWNDFEGLDRVSTPESDSCSQVVASVLRTAGVSTRVVFETDDNLTLQRLVGVGLGCAVVASLAVEPVVGHNDAVIVPLAPSSRINRRIGLVWHRDRNRTHASLGFIEIAQRVVIAGL